ncbi:putative K homology RNA-binding domain containing protein [Lyophyllum shimeji]|uniref:K homology RNA-binding domain containing protein n=1 Tax=Lyophyllum shimeji TaxID=47721 RepID=A0A9P3UKK4_LYOSH|nr:putative K homology RNA-binding domain containing protein [Lyophyllum shimeji]
MSDRKRKWDQAGERDADTRRAAKQPAAEGDANKPVDAAEQAAATAQLAAKYGSSSARSSEGPRNGDRKEANDPQFVKDIDINDIRNRYLLTKGQTQLQVSTLCSLLPSCSGFIGMFVKHIQNETGTRCQIKGQGSGFIETDTGRESDDPMHISIVGPDPKQVERAKALAEDLLSVVREEWQKAKNVLEQYSTGAYYGGYQGYGGYPQQQQPPPLPSGEAPPLPPPGSAPPPPPPSGDHPPPPPGGSASPPAAAAGASGSPPGASGAPQQGQTADYNAYWQSIMSNPQYAACPSSELLRHSVALEGVSSQLARLRGGLIDRIYGSQSRGLTLYIRG